MLVKTPLRVWATLLIVSAIFVVLSSVAAAEQVTLTVVDWFPASYVNDVDKIFSGFTAKHPDVHVEYMNMASPEAASDKIATMLVAGTPPDIITVNDGWVMDLDLSQNAFVDLGPFMKRDRFGLDQLALRYYPQAELGFVNGRFDTFPYFSSFYMMSYSKSAFDAAGLRRPPGQWDQDATWTWTNGFKEAIRKLTKDTNGDGLMERWGADKVILVDPLYPMAFGANYLNKEATAFVGATDRGMLDSLTFAADIISGGYIGGSGIKGTAAIGRIGSWDFNLFGKAMKSDLGVAPYPRGSNDTIIGGPEGFRIFRGSKHVDEAWELVKFLAGKQGQITYAIDTMGLLPLSRDGEVRNITWTTSPTWWKKMRSTTCWAA